MKTEKKDKAGASTDFWKRQFEREQAEREDAAIARGYIVDLSNGNYYVCQIGGKMPLALCASRQDAVRIAYALAMAFPQ